MQTFLSEYMYKYRCRPEVSDIFWAGDHEKMSATSGQHEYVPIL